MKASLVYIVSHKTVRATQWDTVFKNGEEKERKKKERITKNREENGQLWEQESFLFIFFVLQLTSQNKRIEAGEKAQFVCSSLRINIKSRHGDMLCDLRFGVMETDGSPGTHWSVNLG